MGNHGASEKEERFGQDHALIHEAVITGRKVGAGKEFWSRLAHDEAFFKRVVELMNELISFIESTHKVIVDYDMALGGMIAAGKYDWKHGDITPEHFPVKGEGKFEREISLVGFKGLVTTEEIEKELELLGMRPVLIEELLALGTKEPDLQRKFCIPALGSLWRQPGVGRRCIGLGRDYARRVLDLYCYIPADGWNESYRIPAVRK